MKLFVCVLALWVAGAQAATDLSRMAGVTTKMSSLYTSYTTSDKAVDGNRAASFYDQSCMCTKSDKGAWWMIDLKDTYEIESVEVVNRGDCCKDRLADFSIYVSNEWNDVPSSNADLCVHKTGAVGDSEKLTCANKPVGRYVSIQLDGTNYLTMCEVTILGTAKELVTDSNAATILTSLSGVSTQMSSLYTDKTGSEKAIDQNSDPNFTDNSCACTKSEQGAWWMIDLKDTYEIESVFLVNRGDCCPERLGDFSIFVSNEWNGNPSHLAELCVHKYGSVGVSEKLTCSKKPVGRYVSIQLDKKQHLTMCEVVIKGRAKTYVADPNTAINLSLLDGVSTQMSSLYQAETGGEKAVDNNASPTFTDYSCACTKSEKGAWWMVDLKDTYAIESVLIVNRGDCCPERLGDFSIYVSNDWTGEPSHEAELCMHKSGAVGNSESFLCTGEPVGRFVSIQLDGTNYLTMCEVTVMGRPEGYEKDNTKDCPTLPPTTPKPAVPDASHPEDATDFDEYETPDNFGYTGVTYEKKEGMDYIEFEVQATNDARILLLEDENNMETNLYEIVLGAGGNSYSCLRKVLGGNCEVANFGDVLDGNEYKPFVLEFVGEDITVYKGTPTDKVSFLHFGDSSPTPINYIMVSTGWGSTGKWKIGKF